MRRSIDSTTEPPSLAFFAESVICAMALSIRKAGGTRPALRAAWIRPNSPSSCLRVRLQPREVGLRVRRTLDRVVAVEESRDVEIRADVLDDDVGGVAPAADGDVAIGEREALECGGVRAAHDVDAGAGGVREPLRVERLRSIQVSPDLCRGALLPGFGAIGQLRAQARARAGVDPERCRAFGPELHQVVRHLVEQLERVGVAGRGRTSGRRRRAATATTGHHGQRRGRRQRRNRVTSGHHRAIINAEPQSVN